MNPIRSAFLRDGVDVVAATLAYAAFAAIVTWMSTPVDYPVYLMAAGAFANGDNVYTWGDEEFATAAAALGIERWAKPYPYPPLTALLLIPVLGVPYRVGLLVWSLANGAAVIATGVLLGELTGASRRRMVRLSVYALVPFATSMYAGQVNPLATLLAAAACLAIQRGRDGLAGIALACSVLLKPLAIGFVAYAVWRRRTQMLCWFAGCVVVLLMPAWYLTGSAAFGFVGGTAQLGTRAYPPAQNLPSLALRWLSDHAYGPALLDLSGHVGVIGLAVCAVVAAATLVACWPPGRRDWSYVQLGLILTAVLLVNPRTWYHHYTMLAIPIAVLIGSDDPQTAPRWMLASAYAVIGVFGVTWHRLTGYPLLLEVSTYGSLLIWTLLVRACLVSRSAPASAKGTPAAVD